MNKRYSKCFAKTGVVEVINIVEDVDGCDTGVRERDIHRELIKELSDLENKLNDLKFSIDFLKPYTKSTNPFYTVNQV